MNEDGRAERLAPGAVVQFAAGSGVQLLVNQREDPVERSALAPAHPRQKPRDLCSSAILAPPLRRSVQPPATRPPWKIPAAVPSVQGMSRAEYDKQFILAVTRSVHQSVATHSAGLGHRRLSRRNSRTWQIELPDLTEAGFDTDWGPLRRPDDLECLRPRMGRRDRHVHPTDDSSGNPRSRQESLYPERPSARSGRR